MRIGLILLIVVLGACANTQGSRHALSGLPTPVDAIRGCVSELSKEPEFVSMPRLMSEILSWDDSFGDYGRRAEALGKDDTLGKETRLAIRELAAEAMKHPNPEVRQNGRQFIAGVFCFYATRDYAESYFKWSEVSRPTPAPRFSVPIYLPPIYSPPHGGTRCTSNRIGDTVYTNCY